VIAYVFSTAVIFIIFAGRIPTAFAAPCEGLALLSIPHVTITLVQSVAVADSARSSSATPGRAKRPAAESSPFGELPAFCRVAATLTPSTDSDIKIEIWMPAADWNGKFQAVGNGGWAGSISYGAMADALQRGYATTSTDTGHTGGSASFALGHPEKLIDYAFRSEHEMTVTAKAIITAFYGKSPQLSYWNGCSAGGNQGLIEAQRFPADFDGIIAGAPANNWTGRAAQSMWIAQALHKEEGSYIPPSKYALIHSAVLDACDARDGVKDGVLENPTQCKFDPKILGCKGSDAANCLTAAQVEAATKIYSGAINPRTKQEIFPGLEPGSELGWANLGGPRPFGIGEDHFKYVVFQDPNWDFKTLNFDSDIARAEKIDHGTINALDKNLKPFFSHGGKLIQYHGWADQQIASLSSVHYYTSVRAALGDGVMDSYRLFMVPGMGHCRGGDGTDNFDMVGALEQWVEKRKAPDRILASRVKNGVIDRTRPLCPYPKVATYTGKGSTDEAANFVCKAQ
jgi:feruloyl esterase